MPRLIKPAKDNVIGILIALAAVVYSAKAHNWSKRSFLTSLWETVVVPVLLVLCGLILVHIWQASRAIYIEERRVFINALGQRVSLPPPTFRWRCYVATFLWWIAPVGLFIAIWSNYPIPLPGQSRFVIDMNTTVVLPDLHVLNNLPAPSPVTKPPTMLDLFTQDFPTVAKAQNNLTMKDTNLPLKEQIYLDFSAKSKFVGLYVPSTMSDGQDGGETTTAICEAFSVEVEPSLKRLEKNSPMQAGMGFDNAKSLPQLMFTNQVIIYYESILPISQKTRIVKAFKEQDLDVEFRGPEYLASRVATWSRNQKERKD